MKQVHKCLHHAYEFLGHLVCRLLLCWWILRDWLSPPKTNAILFVAHPDDDVLFFHTFIKEYKPYIVLMTTGWSLKRLFAFIRVMHIYGVRFRAYDTRTNRMNRTEFEKRVQRMINSGKFSLCATHNSTGEYGNSTHIFIHDVVLKTCKLPTVVPATIDELRCHPVSLEDCTEKVELFNRCYTTERFVVGQYTEWVKHEWLVTQNR